MRMRDIRRAEQYEGRILQTRAQFGEQGPPIETPRPPLHTETLAKIWRMSEGPHHPPDTDRGPHYHRTVVRLIFTSIRQTPAATRAGQRPLH